MDGFGGNIDGRGHKIEGLYCVSDNDYIGFIGKTISTNRINIEKLRFEKAYVKGNNRVGIIAGYSDNIYVNKCTVDGKVFGNDIVAGIIGETLCVGHNATTICDCTNNADINGKNYIAGIIGYICKSGENGAYNNLCIINCLNTGDVKGTGCAGGIIGRYTTVSGSIGDAEIRKLFNEGDISGESSGGIIGAIYNSADGWLIFYESENIGSVYGSKDGGGFVGMTNATVFATGQKFYYCLNKGVVKGDQNSGGIIGRSGRDDSIYFSCNTGYIEGSNYRGAFVGLFEDPFFQKSRAIIEDSCYYIDSYSKLSCGGSTRNKQENNVIGIKNEETGDQNAYGSFDFVNMWHIFTNSIELQSYLLNKYGNNYDQYNRVINPDTYIVNEVQKYTSPYAWEIFNTILNENSSEDVKLHKLNMVFNYFGLTDINDKSDFARDISKYTRNYLFLTTNENFCAYNWGAWFKSPAGSAARASEAFQAMVYNLEVLDYLDIGTYITADYPAVQKCKDALVEFMKQNMADKEEEEVSCFAEDVLSNLSAEKRMEYAKTEIKYVKNIFKVCNIVENDESKSLLEDLSQAFKDGDEAEYSKCQDAVFDFMKKNGAELDPDSNGIKLKLKSDKFLSAIGKAGKYINVVCTEYKDIKAFFELEKNMEMYEQYTDFLTTVANSTNMSIYLRWAAQDILIEMKEGYLNPLLEFIKDNCEILEDLADTSTEKVFDLLIKGTKRAGFFSKLGEVEGELRLAVFFSNIVIDTGEFEKAAFRTTVYYELGALYSVKLDDDRAAFQSNKTEDNAWRFFQDYTILWTIRYMGESQYLEMSHIKLFFIEQPLKGYSFKKSVVEDTQKILTKECKFHLAYGVKIPDNVQYIRKAIYHCPVDINVYDENEELIVALKDGVVCDVVNEYGRFAVVYDPFIDEYVKIVCVAEGKSVSCIAIGTDIGYIDYQSIDSGVITQADKIEINKNDVLTILPDGVYRVEKSNGDVVQDEVSVRSDADNVAVECILFDSKNIDLKVGEQKLVKCTVSPNNASNTEIIWSSSDSNIASIKNGVITGLKAGETTVNVYGVDNSELVYTISVNVLSAITKIELDKTTLDITVGDDAIKLNPTITPLEAEKEVLIWSSSNTSVVTVNESGEVSAISPGSAIITVSANGSAAKATCSVTVSAAPIVLTGISLDRSTLSMKVGDDPVQLIANAVPEGAVYNGLNWSSSAISVATVNSTGQVSAVAPGTATITVKAAGTDFSASCEITVSKENSIPGPVVSANRIILDKWNLDMKVGDTYKLTATVEPADAKDVVLIWSSSAPRIATVSDNGLVTALKAGDVSISVKVDGTEIESRCNVTISQNTISANKITLDRSSLILKADDDPVMLSASVEPEDADNIELNWSSSDTAVATVSDNGLVSPVGEGDAVITVSVNGTELKASCEVTVLAKEYTISVNSIKIEPENLLMKMGDAPVQLKTVIEPIEAAASANLIWSSTNNKVASVSGNGLVNAVGEGTANINVMVYGTTISADCIVTVSKNSISDNISVNKIILDKEEIILTMGDDPVQLNATIEPEGAKAVLSWSSSDQTVATVTLDGMVTAAGEGNAIISVSADGVSAQCQVTVKPYHSAMNPDPVITDETKELHLVVGQKFTLSETGWSCKEKNYLSISKKNVVKAKKITITPVKLTKGDKSIDVYITKPAMAKKSVTIPAGSSDKLNFNYDSKNLPVLYYSNAPDVATVSDEGKVTAVAKGTATITAYVNGTAYTCKVKVKEDIPAADRTLHMTLNGKKTISIKGVKKVTWVSDDEKIVSVTKKNKIKAEAVGETVLRTEYEGKEYRIQIFVENPTITTKEIQSAGKNKYKLTLAPNGSSTIEFVFIDQPVIFKSSKGETAYVDADGTIHANRPGKAKLTTKINGKTITITVTVK